MYLLHVLPFQKGKYYFYQGLKMIKVDVLEPAHTSVSGLCTLLPNFVFTGTLIT